MSASPAVNSRIVDVYEHSWSHGFGLETADSESLSRLKVLVDLVGHRMLD